MVTYSKYFVLISLLIVGCTRPIPKVTEVRLKCEKETKHVFINGIANDFAAASRARNRLSDKVGVDFHLLHNYSSNRVTSIVEDLLQSYQQKKKAGDLSLPLRIVAILQDAFRPETNQIEIYSDSEKDGMERVLRESKHLKHTIVSHSQGNLFAEEICRTAKLKPTVYALATPVLKAFECERFYANFYEDVITKIGKPGNFRYIAQAGDSFMKAHFLDSYLEERNKVVGILKTQIKKKPVTTPIIEQIGVRSFFSFKPVLLDYSNTTRKSISCSDITSKEVTIISPDIAPDLAFGFEYLLQVKGKGFVNLIKKGATVPWFTLSITRAPDTEDEYIIKPTETSDYF